VSPINGAINVASPVTLTWDDSLGESQYLLELDTTPAFNNPSTYPLPQNSTQSSPLQVQPGTSYWWRVTASNPGGSTLAANAPFSFTAQLNGDMGTGGDAGNLPTTATPINVPISGQGQLGGPDIDDYFLLQLFTPATLSVSLTSPANSDCDLELFCVQTTDPSRFILQSAHPAGQLDSLSFGANISAIIRVHLYSGSGTYSLSITATPDPSKTPDPPPSLPTIFLSAHPTNFGAGAPSVERVVMHTVEGSLRSAVQTFMTQQQPGQQRSAHYVLGNEGEIVQMVRNLNIGYHAGNWWYNNHSLGIEHEGYADNAVTWTPKILQTSTQLMMWLVGQYGIVRTRQFVIGHYDVPRSAEYAPQPTYKTDPGPYFPWANYMAQIGGVSQIWLTPLRVTTSNLNVREGPDGSATILTQVHSNQQYVGRWQENGWFLIQVGAHPGWVSSSFVAVLSAGTGVLYPAQGISLLNVRDAPNGNIIGKAVFNDAFSWIATSGGWHQIYFQGTSGAWVSASYTQLLGLPGALP
jgi:N-acetyl-anhydromuramyl-L-alanine amidase AmpD